MLQEDSTGEASFEIIDKRKEESSSDKTSGTSDSLSTLSSPYSIPSPGGLLSNLPPSNAPTLWQGAHLPIPAPSPLPPTVLPPARTIAVTPLSEQQYPTAQFSAAIPPIKGVQHGPVPQTNEGAEQGGGLIGWMKDAVSTGGILQKVAEKAKSSVDSLITTLDPQMSEFIYSGGDIEIVIASNDEGEVSALRHAIYAVLGKAWVSGVEVKVTENKHRAIGFEEGIKRAEERIEVFSKTTHKVPIIAIESILLHECGNWYDLSVLVLKDISRGIAVQTFSHTTPVPLEDFLKRAEKDMPVYSKECDSQEKLLSAYLQSLDNDWYHEVSGVSRKESLLLPGKVLLNLYKNKLDN